MIDTGGFAFQKPGHRKREPVPAVKVYPDGREVCTKSAAGRREYKGRTKAMWLRQKGCCCICGNPLKLDEATFEHSRPRGHGGGFRDDRIVVDGHPINGAAHGLCNTLKGSKHGWIG